LKVSKFDGVKMGKKQDRWVDEQDETFVCMFRGMLQSTVLAKE